MATYKTKHIKKNKPYIRIPFLTPPNKKHKSIRDYDRKQNQKIIDKELNNVGI